MADETSRGAARWAAVGALPIAVVAGAAVFVALGGLGPPADSGGHPPGAAGPGPAPTTGSQRVEAAPVPVAAPALSRRAAAVCRALVARLPRALPDPRRDLGRRRVTAGPHQNAAYGEPAITLACGGPAVTVRPTDLVLLLDTVCWHAQSRAGATMFTTLGREVPVRVTVPDAYAPAGQRAVPFAAPVLATVRPAGQRPTGCAPVTGAQDQ